MSWLIVDLETENHEYYNSVASPFHAQNYVVAPGWALDDGPVQHRYFNSREEADTSDWFKTAIQNAAVLVAHNATFELHWFLHRHYSDLMAFFKRGGRVYCTQLAEYLLSGQTETYPALDSTAPKYGGTHKIDEVKVLWEQGALTSEIPKDLLLTYLAGPEGDIENTRKVLFGQLQKLEEKGMLQMVLERNDALLFNAICTFNGLYIDMETAKKNHVDQLAEADRIRNEILQQFPKDLPKEFNFNFGSDYHMSAWLFGGPVKYDVKVSYNPIKYELADYYYYGKNQRILVEDYNNLPLAERNEIHKTIKLYTRGKNAGLFKVFREETDVEKLKWGEAVYRFPGLINLKKLPLHVRDNYLGRNAQFRGKRTLYDDITPVYSTSADSLDLLKNFTDVAKPLARLAELDKDNGTYYIKHEYDANGNVKKVKGMLQYVNENNIIHHQLNGTSTVTARLSSSNPNLQNLPRDGTSKVKEMFTSRFGPSGRICEIDYTALEVVTGAAASGDKNLLNALLSGTDMHCYRLAGALGESYEEVLAKCKDENHPDHKQYKQLRIDIKPRAFAAQYGASPAGISFATGCTIEEAEQFLETEAKLFPESIAFRSVIREEVERTGAKMENIHREMMDDGRWLTYRVGQYRGPGGTIYSFRQREQWKEGVKVLDYKDTEIANYWNQGEASFIVQVACGLVIRWLIQNDFFDHQVLPINTVHDAIYLDCINEEWAAFGSKYVAELMSYAPKYMCEVMLKYKEWGYDTIPFPAVPEVGQNMHTKHHV